MTSLKNKSWIICKQPVSIDKDVFELETVKYFGTVSSNIASIISGIIEQPSSSNDGDLLPSHSSSELIYRYIMKMHYSREELIRLFGEEAVIYAKRLDKAFWGTGLHYCYEPYCVLVNDKVKFILTNCVQDMPKFESINDFNLGIPDSDNISISIPISVQKVMRRSLERSQGARPQERHCRDVAKETKREIRNNSPIMRNNKPAGMCCNPLCDSKGDYIRDGRNYCWYHYKYEGYESD